MLAAHAYWRLRGLEVDLVILNEHPSSYFEELHQQMQNLVRGSEMHGLMDKPGGVFLRKADQMPEEDKVLLQAAARVVLTGSHGSLAGQVDRLERVPMLPPRLKATRGSGDSGEAETARQETSGIAVRQRARRVRAGWPRICHSRGGPGGNGSEAVAYRRIARGPVPRHRLPRGST